METRVLQENNIKGRQPNGKYIEPEKDVSLRKKEIDFSLWNRLYGRELTEKEKIEIEENTKAFFTVLIQESQKAYLK